MNVTRVMLMHGLVNWFLLMGASRLCGCPAGPLRALTAAVAGGIYGGACLIPGFLFLGNLFWHTVILLCLALIAYGFQKSTLRRSMVFLLLNMAFGGFALRLGTVSWYTVILSAGSVCILCIIGFRGRIHGTSYVPVELVLDGRQYRLTALRDTGNTLTDPVSGTPVLIIDGPTAEQITGLTAEQLRQPVETLARVPGMRLIPYRSVGTPAGLLLARKIPGVTIGSWRGSRVVAFAPEKLSMNGEYQALTGGMA